MNRKLKILLFLSSLFFFRVGGQEPYMWRLTDEDGLPNMTVYDMLQDKKGYIWIATGNGVCRYDGKFFKTFHSDEMNDFEIMKIEEDKWGRIWFYNLTGQLFYIENDSVALFRTAPERAGVVLFRIKVLDEHLFVNYRIRNDSSHVYHFRLKESFDDTINFKQVLKFPKVIASMEPRFNRNHNQFIIWSYQCAQEKCCFYNFDLVGNYYGNRLLNQKVMMKWGGRYNIDFLSDTTFLLYGLKGGGIFHSKSLDRPKIEFLIPFVINNTQIPANTQIWFMTKSGALVKTLEGYEINNEWHLLPDINTYSVLKTKEGSYWIGTNGQGIFIVPSLDFYLYDTRNSDIKNEKITCIASYKNESVLIGHEKGILSGINGKGKITRLETGMQGNLRAILPAKDNSIWFAVDEVVGIMGRFGLTNKNVASIMGGIKTILFDKEGNLWVGNFSSTFCIKKPDLNKNSPTFLQRKNLLHLRTYALHQALDGTMWIGSYQGIYTSRNENTAPFTENGKQIPYRVSAITQTKDSSIWVATLGNGLLRIKNDKIVARYSKEHQFVTSTFNCLFPEDDHLWTGTDKGLFRINTFNKSMELIDKYDGLPSNDVTAVAVQKGMAWVGTPKGLISFPVSSIFKNDIPPPVYITKLKIWDKDTTLLPHYELPYNLNNLQIEFIGLGYRAKGNVAYRYRMIGIDSGWVTTTARFARFPAIAAGKYNFEVVAINEDGTASDTPAKLSFAIAPPWWQTWWFYTCVVTSVLGAGWLLMHQRYKRLQKEERQRQEFQTKINELKLEALQTQMNPHFIFNALNSIQHFLTTSDEERAMFYLSKFARMVRLIFEFSQKKEIFLEEEIEFLNLYLLLEKLRFQDKIEINLEVSPEVMGNLHAWKVPPLLIQPIVENAFKHGLLHKMNDGILNVTFTIEHDQLKCVVEDNGVGREFSSIVNGKKPFYHNSSGISTTKERLEIINKTRNSVTLIAHLDIIDLKNDKRAPSGTRVEIYF